MALTGFSVRIDGPANEVEWEQPDPIDYYVGALASATFFPPSYPTVGGNPMITSTGAISGERQEFPLWPRTVAGYNLRKLYRDEGERALCEPGAAPWWADDRESW